MDGGAGHEGLGIPKLWILDIGSREPFGLRVDHQARAGGPVIEKDAKAVLWTSVCVGLLHGAKAVDGAEATPILGVGVGA